MDATTTIQTVRRIAGARNLLRQSGLIMYASVAASNKLARYARVIQWCWRRCVHDMEALQCQ